MNKPMNRFFSVILLNFFYFSICTAQNTVVTKSSPTQALPSVSILGDSYSTYKGFIPNDYAIFYPHSGTDVKSVTQTWWHQFISKNGYKLSVNNSFSGSTICNTGYGGEDYSDRSFITRITKLGNPDIIFIFGGTNDSWANSPIGEYKYIDWTDRDLFSFRPALAYLLSGLREHYPNVTIYYLLNSELKPEINESSKIICEKYGVELIELHNIDKQAGHPSIKGMKAISDQIEEFLGIK